MTVGGVVVGEVVGGDVVGGAVEVGTTIGSVGAVVGAGADTGAGGLVARGRGVAVVVVAGSVEVVAASTGSVVSGSVAAVAVGSGAGLVDGAGNSTSTTRTDVRVAAEDAGDWVVDAGAAEPGSGSLATRAPATAPAARTAPVATARMTPLSVMG
jgi:hypothetical protein